MIEQNFVERYTNIIESCGLSLYSPIDFLNTVNHFDNGLHVTIGGWSDSFSSTLTTPFYYTKIKNSASVESDSFWIGEEDVEALNENVEKLKNIYDKLESVINIFKNDYVGRTAYNISDYTNISMIPPLVLSPYFSVPNETRLTNPFDSAVFDVKVSPVIPSSDLGLNYYEINTPCFVKIFDNVPYLFYIESDFYFIGRSAYSSQPPCGQIGLMLRAFYTRVNR